MKLRSSILLILTLAVSDLSAQEIYGVWRMVSVKGTEPNGQKFSFDETQFHETKIITPGHFMMISQDAKTDSLLLWQSWAGDAKITGNQIEEVPTTTLHKLSDKAKAVFAWKINGDRLIERGTITLSDGTKVIVEELIYRKITPP